MTQIKIEIDDELLKVLNEELCVIDIDPDSYIEFCIAQHLKYVGVWHKEHYLEGRLL
jgi:hypothetical protein